MTRVFFGLALVVFASSTPAFANGRFPNASLLVIAPNDPEHWVARTTFGLLESRDRGASFSWICEQALELDDQEDPMLTLTADGSLVAATYDGIVKSGGNSCGFAFAPEAPREIIGDLARDPDAPERIAAYTVRGLALGGFFSQLLLSEDNGESFVALGQPLASELLPLSLDIAKSSGRRVYMTGRLGMTAGYRSVLLRSNDGGESFRELDIPDTNDRSLAFIAAVHPHDPDRVYVRTSDPAGNRLLMSRDGGDTFTSVFIAVEGLYGFAISPDGDEMVFGGPKEGVWAASALDAAGMEFRSQTPVSCLTYSGDALYACVADEMPMAISRSLDAGRSFDSVLSLDTLCGASACDRETQVGQLCAAYWPPVARTLNTTCGVDVASTGGTQNGGNSSSGRANESELRSSGGCSMQRPSRSTLGASLFLLAALARRRRRSKGRGRLTSNAPTLDV